MKVPLDCWQFGVTITYHFSFVPLAMEGCSRSSPSRRSSRCGGASG
jgi:hypothetical protein